jgi:hypothetical protein
MKHCIKIYLVFAITTILLFLSHYLAKGEVSGWNPPDIIPGYHTETRPPVLIADQNRTVHAFSSQWIGDGENMSKAIMYNQWTYDQGWTLPNDIVLSPIGQARILDAYLDPSGVVHLIFFGGDNTYANVYYTKALAMDAANPRAWQSPTIIAQNAGDPESGVILWDDRENLRVLFHGRTDGNGVYEVYKADGGDTWSNVSQVFLPSNTELFPYWLQYVKSDLGTHHVVWNMVNVGGQGRGIFYTSRHAGEIEWREPIILDTSPEGLGTDRPAIIEHKGILYVIYNNGGLKMRFSTDDGLSWEPFSRLFTRHVGYNGSLSLVIDGNDDLHLFFGQRISGSPDIHGMWHSHWQTPRWTEPEPVISGPQVVDKTGFHGFDPFDARSVVSQGNMLLVTWRTDPGLKGNGVWFSYKQLAASELTYKTLPVISLTPTLKLAPTYVPTNIPMGSLPNPAYSDGFPDVMVSSPFTDNPLIPVFIGIIPVLIFAVGLVIIQFIGQKKKL